jgi:tetratricopeptide (TPR) repeat protein
MFLASTFCCHSTGISISISACAVGTSNDYRDALDAYERAGVLAKQAGDESFLAELASNRGIVYRRSGDVPSALRCYQEALEKATLLKDWNLN